MIGMLRLQLDVTTEGVDALVAWARGESAKGEEIRSPNTAAKHCGARACADDRVHSTSGRRICTRSRVGSTGSSTCRGRLCASEVMACRRSAAGRDVRGPRGLRASRVRGGRPARLRLGGGDWTRRTRRFAHSGESRRSIDAMASVVGIEDLREVMSRQGSIAAWPASARSSSTSPSASTVHGRKGGLRRPRHPPRMGSGRPGSNRRHPAGWRSTN